MEGRKSVRLALAPLNLKIKCEKKSKKNTLLKFGYLNYFLYL